MSDKPETGKGAENQFRSFFRRANDKRPFDLPEPPSGTHSVAQDKSSEVGQQVIVKLDAHSAQLRAMIDAYRERREGQSAAKGPSDLPAPERPPSADPGAGRSLGPFAADCPSRRSR